MVKTSVPNKIPRVSIIIPYYDRPISVLKSIQSVLDQTYKNWELLVVDDGSKVPFQMGSLDKSHKIKVLYHKKNKGAAAARNTGIKYSQGQLIAFLDSDDYWLPEKLELQVKALEDADDKIGGCVTGVHLITSIKKRIRYPKIKNFYHQTLRGDHMSMGSTLLFKKKCLKKIGLQKTDLPRLEDWEWQINFARHYGLIATREALAYIQVSSHPSFESVEKSIKIIKNRFKFDSSYEKTLFEGRCAYELALSAFLNRKWIKAVRYGTVFAAHVIGR